MSKVTITEQGKKWENNIRAAQYSLGAKPKVLNNTGLSEEQLEEMSAMLDNILQDALITCEEACCADEADKIDINAISRTIVKTLTEDLLLPKFDVLEYQKQINELRKQLAESNKESKSDYYIKKSKYYNKHPVHHSDIYYGQGDKK
jgi:hypothetical protein